MPKISVIVPVYKVEPYIHRCVESILAQTYTDYEVILVDDGSPDNCGTICDEYARVNSRVRVIHKENRGISSARNAGIRIATGEYICFVDSDDLIHPQLLSLLVQALSPNEVCYVACGIHASPTIPTDFFSPVETSPTPARNIDEPFVSELVTEGYNAWTASAKLVPTDIVRKHLFTEGRIYEDNAVVLSWLLECSEYIYVDAPLYLYFTDNPTGINRTTMTQKKNLDFLWALSERYRALQNAGMHRLAEKQLRSMLFWGKDNGAAPTEDDPAASAEIRSFLRPFWRQYFISGSFHIKKDFALLEYFNPFFHPVFNLIRKAAGR